MQRTYDLFERLPDGSLMWRMTVDGHEQALAKLKEHATTCGNEVQLHHLPTKAVIATMNADTGPSA